MTSRLRCRSYNECVEAIYPENPEAPFRQKQGYSTSLCDTCYGYKLKPIEVEPSAITELSQFLLEKIKRLDDLQGRMIHNTNKLNEHLDKKKKRGKY